MSRGTSFKRIISSQIKIIVNFLIFMKFVSFYKIINCTVANFMSFHVQFYVWFLSFWLSTHFWNLKDRRECKSSSSLSWKVSYHALCANVDTTEPQCVWGEDCFWWTADQSCPDPSSVDDIGNICSGTDHCAKWHLCICGQISAEVVETFFDEWKEDVCGSGREGCVCALVVQHPPSPWP